MNKSEAMIWSVLRRPVMYTVTGSYEEVVSFLEGFYSGIPIDHPHHSAVKIWNDFTEYIRQHLKVSSSRVYKAFRDQHGQGSLESLQAIYTEFHEAHIAAENSEKS